MAAKTLLTYDQPPAVAPAYLRAAITLGGGLDEGGTIPRIQSTIDQIKIDRRRLSTYRQVCGFAQASNTLPVTYPHILAFPVHMAVMTHENFPLKLLGLVHVRNEINQNRAIAVSEALNLKVHVGGHRDVHNGIEFDLITEFTDSQGQPVWDSRSTMLSRGKSKAKKSGRKKKSDEEPLEFGRYATWDAPADIGRRYARSAGDINPIHLTALSAKLFGFPRAIAHGMWLKARAAAEIENQLQQDKYTISVAFKRPVLLPSSVVLKYNPNDKGIDFMLADPDGETRHMSGEVVYR